MEDALLNWLGRQDDSSLAQIMSSLSSSNMVALEVMADRQVGALGEADLTGFGQLLHAGGQVGRVPDGRVIHAEVVADLADDDQPGVEPIRTWISWSSPPPPAGRCLTAPGMAKAARVARRAWSSCARGAPKSAMIVPS